MTVPAGKKIGDGGHVAHHNDLASLKLDVATATATYQPAVRAAAATAAQAFGSYDPHLGLYGFKPSHLARTRAWLGAAAAGTGLCKIGVLGTSIAAGQGLASFATQAWPYLLRNLLTTRDNSTSGGTGPVLLHNADSGSDARWAFTGTWTKFSNPNTKTTLMYPAANGDRATFTSDQAGTVVEVRYSNTGAAFTVAIDGAAAVTVTPAGGSSFGTYTVTGLADTVHTVVITRVSGVMYISSAEVRRTAGVVVANLSLGGSTVADWLASTQDYHASELMREYAPHLLLVDAMTNEAGQSVAPSVFQANLDSLVTIHKAQSDIVLIAEIPAGGSYDMSGYQQAVYAVAKAHDLPVLDLFHRWGSYATANANGLMADQFHPTAAGQRDYARAVAAVIR